jgi:hypothetical protein
MHETGERGKMEGVANEGLSTDGFGGTRGVSQPPRLRFSARFIAYRRRQVPASAAQGPLDFCPRSGFKFSGMFSV